MVEFACKDAGKFHHPKIKRWRWKKMRIRKNMLVIFPGDRSEGYNPADIGVTVKKFKKHSWEVVVLGIFLEATPMWSGVYKTFKEEKLIPMIEMSRLTLPMKLAMHGKSTMYSIPNS